MDGVFMRKIIKLAVIIILVMTLFSVIRGYHDRQFLKDHIVRLHVVANSDSTEDQQIKLRVKDAVAETIRSLGKDVTTKEQMLAILSEKLPEIESFANRVLEQCGVTDRARVSLREESFGKRVYETFSLPSGIYDSLRIVIGEGQGKNWWCVLFPSLCVPAAGESFDDTAAGAGFSRGLTETISNTAGYRVRFFLIDCIGKLENIFH